MNTPVTENDLARARTDAGFRQQMLADHLERLLSALNAMRRNNDVDPVSARQIREGVDLAVKLAEKLQQKTGQTGPRAA